MMIPFLQQVIQHTKYHLHNNYVYKFDLNDVLRVKLVNSLKKKFRNFKEKEIFQIENHSLCWHPIMESMLLLVKHSNILYLNL